MQNYTTAPHQGLTRGTQAVSPNAALLIDFDNVTMGIRSDLTRQLKELLNSDIIKGKVAVQRAYADWRRYAQYIVPLSEASVDLIFAPAYGSSKKNATDIRLAIDALELVFTRPEIGTFILLSGDSDFSSLVLKLKEYGKYVVGVGLRESASDLLVQNCDEYYSYSALTGLTRAGDEVSSGTMDPFELVERSVLQMAEDNDVMRSDRLKQVMLELDANFDESQLGYSKFNKFLVEAASKGKLAVRKMDNGQYEVQPYEEGGATETAREDRGRGSRRGRGRREERKPAAEAPRQQTREAARPQPPAPVPPSKPAPRPSTRQNREENLEQAYELLLKAVDRLIDQPGGAARDSDIKRQILEIQSGWDESELGFTKFSRFLRQAHADDVIDLQRSAEGYYEARPVGTTGRGAERDTRAEEPEESSEPARGRGEGRGRGSREQQGRGRGRDAGDTQATDAAPVSTTERTPEEDTAPAGADAAAGPTEPAEEPETPEASEAPEAPEAPAQPEERVEAKPAAEVAASSASSATPETPETPSTAARKPSGRGRMGRRGGGTPDGPPPLLPGQVVGGSSAGTASKPAPSEPASGASGAGGGNGAGREPKREPERKPEREPEREAAAVTSSAPPAQQTAGSVEAAGNGGSGAKEWDRPPASFDADSLGLPTDSGAVIRYLSNSYQGVGQKTAEALIGAFGEDRVFHGLHHQPDRVRELLGSGRRTEQLLEAWSKDYRRRSGGDEGGQVGD